MAKAQPKLKAAKLTDEQAERIIVDIAEKLLTQDEIAIKYNTNRSSISNIATNRSFKHLARIEKTVKRRGGQYLNLDEQVAALEREVWHLREERNHARRIAKVASKSDGLVQHVVDVMEDVITPMAPPKKIKRTKSKKKTMEHAVLLLSDQHIDQIVAPSSVNGHETYNFKIGVRRAEVLVEEVLKFLTETMCGFDFEQLHVLSLGDNISSPIHNHTTRSAFKNDFVNAFAAGQVMAAMLHELSPHFDKVNVLGLSGNHPRRTVRKAYPEPLDNFDYLVVKEASMLCRDHSNIEFNIPDSYTHIQEVNGHRIFACHGDDLKGPHPIQALKALHAKQCQMDANIDAYVCGHFHQPGQFQLTAQNGKSPVAVSNGAWVGTDPYCYNALATGGEPSQMLFGVHAHNGVTWNLPFRMRTADEHLGPQRYNIELAEHALDSFPTTGARRV